jgi:hypothetical protein
VPQAACLHQQLAAWVLAGELVDGGPGDGGEEVDQVAVGIADGLVAHSGRWYVTGADPGIGENRTFRLDRIADARILPGSFEPPARFDPAQHVLSGLATTPYRYQVTLRIQGPIDQIRARLPASVATVEELPSADALEPESERWFRVELHAERLDWLPPLLASLDRPFAVERPDELRDLITALAGRLETSARRNAPPSKPQRPGELMSEIELTPAHFRALPILDPDEPWPMRSTIVLPLRLLAHVKPGDGPTDDHALDLRRALENREDLRVPVHALDRVLPGVAVTAEDLDGLLGDAHRGLPRH